MTKMFQRRRHNIDAQGIDQLLQRSVEREPSRGGPVNRTRLFWRRQHVDPPVGSSTFGTLARGLREGAAEPAKALH